MDRSSRWTAAALRAAPGFHGLPRTHAGFLSDLRAMQERIVVGKRPFPSDLLQLRQPIRPIKAVRWIELLFSSRVCNKPQTDSDGKLYAALGTKPLTLENLLAHAKNAAEAHAIQCFYPQVRCMLRDQTQCLTIS